jgi:hypothetical protein
LDCGGQAQRDPAFARTEIFRITNVSRPPESAVAAPALPAQSKIVHPKLPLAARLGHCWGARPSRLPFPASHQKERGVHAASPLAQPHAQQFSNALANSHIEAA